jgi:hypothetical protein
MIFPIPFLRTRSRTLFCSSQNSGWEIGPQKLVPEKLFPEISSLKFCENRDLEITSQLKLIVFSLTWALSLSLSSLCITEKTKNTVKCFFLSLGVSICLDRVSIESLDIDVVKECISTVDKILTASKSASRQLRNLGRDRDFSILSRHQCPDQKVSIEIKKFIKVWKFWHFLTVCLDLDWKLVNFIIFLDQDFSICWDFWAWCTSTSLKNVEISWQISLRLNKSHCVSTILTKILMCQSLDWKVSIWKILTKTKKVRRNSWENLDSF